MLEFLYFNEKEIYVSLKTNLYCYSPNTKYNGKYQCFTVKSFPYSKTTGQIVEMVFLKFNWDVSELKMDVNLDHEV